MLKIPTILVRSNHSAYQIFSFACCTRETIISHARHSLLAFAPVSYDTN